jgi:hypothetical protein
VAWIESHTVLIKHRKLVSLARDLRLKPVYCLGHLHAFWHAVLEQQEDGDLSAWSDEQIAEISSWQGDAVRYVQLLQLHGWLTGRKVHDWLDYAGLFLSRKYSTSNRQRLVDIWNKHGREYGAGPRAGPKRTVSEQLANSSRTVSEQNCSHLTKPPSSANPKDSFGEDGIPTQSGECAQWVELSEQWVFKCKSPAGSHKDRVGMGGFFKALLDAHPGSFEKILAEILRKGRSITEPPWDLENRLFPKQEPGGKPRKPTHTKEDRHRELLDK